MFPVTLEFDKEAGFKNNIKTIFPPCYGFLRQIEYEEDAHDYIEGSWAFTYQANPDSVRRRPQQPFGSSNMEYNGRSDAVCEVSCDAFAMEDLRIIWNSGSMLPLEGYVNGELVAHQYHNTPNRTITYGGEISAPPEDMVARWATENIIHGKDVNIRGVMELFEKWLDKDSESCLRWHDKGFMGVTADVPCDRALFYLMLNRALHNRESAYWVDDMLDDIYIGDVPPMIAFLKTRMVATGQGWSAGKVIYNAGNGDSCIFPSDFLWIGMGQCYKEPRQVEWFQKTYTDGIGHLRDEDLESYMYSVPDKFEESFSSSIFMALSMLGSKNIHGQKVLINPQTDEPAFPLVVEFTKRVVKPETYATASGSFDRYGVYRTYWNSQELPDYIDDQGYAVHFKDWKNLALKLLMGE